MLFHRLAKMLVNAPEFLNFSSSGDALCRPLKQRTGANADHMSVTSSPPNQHAYAKLLRYRVTQGRRISRSQERMRFMGHANARLLGCMQTKPAHTASNQFCTTGICQSMLLWLIPSLGVRMPVQPSERCDMFYHVVVVPKGFPTAAALEYRLSVFRSFFCA